LQANVNFLQRTMTRNVADANRRLQLANTEIAALRAAVTELRKQLDELQAERKADDKKSESKKQ
jgi:polyhydroxyalkanoate synthesis regulator phasin